MKLSNRHSTDEHCLQSFFNLMTSTKGLKVENCAEKYLKGRNNKWDLNNILIFQGI